MKKIFAVVLVAVVAMLGSNAAAKKAKTFEGIISYTITATGDPSITSSFEMMPAEMLVATLKTKGHNSVFSVMGQKTYLDSKKNIMTSLIDLSMLGMGTYCLENPYDGKTTPDKTPVFTGETKTICGYTAEKVTIASTDSTTIEAWVTRDMTIDAAVPLLPGITNCVPLQFNIETAATGMGSIKLTLTANEVKQQKVPSDDLVPPKNCQSITPEELNTMMQSIRNFGNDFDE